MGELINGRTAEEIKHGLRVCNGWCDSECPYSEIEDGCAGAMVRDALALIEWLEAAQPRWIKLSENVKPKSSGFYVTMTRILGYRQETCYYNAEFDDWWSNTSTNARCINGYVDYWLDGLPEPPKEDANE